MQINIEQNNKKYALCLVDVNNLGTRTFSYLIPEHLKDEIKVGQAVLVPFGHRKQNIIAFVSGFSDFLESGIKANLVPTRFVAESLGAKVTWTEAEPSKVLITKGDVEIIIYIGSDKAYVNGKEVMLDSPAFIENDRTYTPIRFISEELGATVEWNQEAQTVTITQK